MTLYAWPARTVFGRVIPKSRIYKAAAVPRGMQARFTDQVERVSWSHVLRADTLNLRASPEVEEIAVIAVALRAAEAQHAVLAAIDKAIPRPVIMELTHGGRVRMAAAWKRPSLAEAGKWVTGPLGFTPWQPVGAARQPLPAALDIGSLYAALLDPLLPSKLAPDEPIADRVARAEEVTQIEREISRLETSLKRERQFNRKVEINTTLRGANEKLKTLIGDGDGQKRRTLPDRPG